MEHSSTTSDCMWWEERVGLTCPRDMCGCL